jgi:catechol-2,3-dioxygenase
VADLNPCRGLLLWRARLQLDAALRARSGVPVGRGLSPPHRFEHLGKQRGSPPAPDTTGLYHVAIRYHTRAALANALRRLIDAGISLEGASNHGVSEALYLRDPDSNGIELSWDRPKAEWPLTKDGHLDMVTRALDTRELLSELTA